MEAKTSNEIEKNAEKNSITIGKNIRRKRIEQNISQEYLAEILELSRQSISKWENGLSEPSTKNLAKLASIFKCDISDLLSGETAPSDGGTFAVIGVVVDKSDIGKMKFFFQEIPSDLLKRYDTSLVVLYNGDDNNMGDIASYIELYIGTCNVINNAEDKLEFKPNMIYLMSMDVYGGTIDQFYEYLVRFHGKITVAVLMSDFGQEGIKGLRQVKNAGGMSVLCESVGNGENKWNTTSDGFFDYVLEPVCMGYWISAFVRKEWFEKWDKYKGIFGQRFHHRVQDCLQSKGGYSFTDFKEEYMLQSLHDRIEETGLPSSDYYIRMLENTPEEQTIFLRKLLDNVRKPGKNWAQLVEIKELFNEIKPEVNGVRIWVVGCGNGLEAYVVAMLLADHMERYQWNDRIKIFATDIDEEVIATAIQGHFSAQTVEGFPDRWKRNYLRQVGDEYQISQNIRNMVIFSVHDVLSHPPFARIGLLICRDVLKKYRIRSRKTMLSRFSYSLKENGYLVLSQDEDMAELHVWFDHIPRFNGRIWIKQKNAPRSIETWVPDRESFSVDNVIQELITSTMPSCVVIDDQHEILYTGKGAGKYLQFKSGIFSKSLFDNVDIRMRVLLETALKYLQESKEYHEVLVFKNEEGERTNVNVHVLAQTVRERDYYLIWFEEIDGEEDEPNNQAISKREESLERELEMSQNRLAQTLKELGETKDNYSVINEKLQSTNEELILMNDELQMVNQELTASNRKLTRVNGEYQKRISEMPEFVMDSVDFFELLCVNVIILDQQMKIVKMSEGVPGVSNIKESDLGRDISEINLINGYIGWARDLVSLTKGQKIIRILNKDNHRISVELYPYFFAKHETSGYVVVLRKIELEDTDYGSE